MKYRSFREYCELREGLWLADKNAVPGMSKINPFPTTQAELKRTRAKPMKIPKPHKAIIPPIASPLGRGQR
jgi:hypothetical protein